MSDLVVIKVGGSLYDLDDLGPRLRRWLETDARVRSPATVVLVPGGGPMADAVREYDRCHGLGAEAAHWLALRALSLNAFFLAELVPLAVVVADVLHAGPRVQILDACAFLKADEQRHAAMTIPHSWDATSDTVAARVAVVAQARRLILLKSAPVAFDAVGLEDTLRNGLVDPLFASMLRTGREDMEFCAINLRDWRG